MLCTFSTTHPVRSCFSKLLTKYEEDLSVECRIDKKKVLTKVHPRRHSSDHGAHMVLFTPQAAEAKQRHAIPVWSAVRRMPPKALGLILDNLDVYSERQSVILEQRSTLVVSTHVGLTPRSVEPSPTPIRVVVVVLVLALLSSPSSAWKLASGF